MAKARTSTNKERAGGIGWHTMTVKMLPIKNKMDALRNECI